MDVKAPSTASKKLTEFEVFAIHSRPNAVRQAFTIHFIYPG
jgi:hypothetical protein